MISSEQITELRNSLEPVYKSLDSYAPWEESWCVEWSSLALPIARTALSRQDFDLQEYICSPKYASLEPLGYQWSYHHFIADVAAGDPLIIDGTYLQFGKQPYSGSVPHIMIALASQTPNILDAANIPAGIWYQWRADLYGSSVFKQPTNR